MCGNPNRDILANSPELLFMSAICAKDIEKAASLFCEKKLFGNEPVAVDAPNGRFTGLSGVRTFAGKWLDLFHAQSAYVTPVFQTRANGRSVTELVVNFVVDGEINQVSMFVVGDLRVAGKVDEIRIYFHYTYAYGLTGYRRPIFRSSHLEMGEPGLLTGAVREYYEALHHVPAVDVDRIIGSMGANCKFGGYEPDGGKPMMEISREELRKIYENMAAYIPKWVGMRYETIVDDGVNCVIEWVHIVTKEGQEKGARVCISGISSYERGEDGLLCSIRISDYAGFERQIDWSKTPISKAEAMSINLVDSFPPYKFQK